MGHISGEFLDAACAEQGYAPACTLPGNESLFRDIRPLTKTRLEAAQMLDACVACEVRLECLADAVNVVLDMGKIDPKHVASFRAGKGPMQQVAMAREFQHNGLGHVTRDEVAANWRSALPT